MKQGMRIAVCAVLLVLWRGWAWGQPVGSPPTVAMVGVGEERQSPELQTRQEGLVHLVQSELAGRSGARVVSRRQMARFLDELGMGAAELTESATSQRFGRAASADYLVLLHIVGGDRLAADVTVENLATGTQMWSETVTSPARDLPALAAAVADVLTNKLHLPPAQAPLAVQGAGSSLAILDFHSDGAAGKLDTHLSELADLLSAGLTALDVPLVDRQKLSAVLTELGLSASGLVRAADMAKVGHLVGAERMLDTSLIASGATVVFDCQVIQPETGVVVASCRVTGEEAKLPAVVQELATKVAQALHFSITEAGRSNLAEQATSSVEAALHAAAGWRLGCENRPEEAIRELQQAVYLDPHLASAWQAMARQYQTLGDHTKWAECARRFFPAAEGKADRTALAKIAVELANAEMWLQDFAGEEAAARLGLSYDPGNPGLHERLIIALARQGKAKEVQAHCDRVYREDTPPYALTYSVYVYALHWLSWWGSPSNATDEVAQVEFGLFARALDIFDHGMPDKEFRFGIVMRDALLYECGAAVEGGAGVRLTPPR